MPGRPDAPPARGGRRDGFVLIAVLSVTALLALMLGVSSLLARGATDTAGIEALSLRQDALLAAGVELAGHQLFALRVSPASIDGQQVRMNGGTLTLFVSSEAGRVDINGGDADLLASAYRAAGLADLGPEVFAARVIDWRDEDDEISPDGAEAADYQAAGLAQGPANAPFRAVGDLQWVLGLGPADVAALAPFVTVFNPSGTIDPLAAPQRLLESFPGMTPENAGILAALPESPGVGDILVLRAAFRGQERHLILGDRTRAYAVRIEARLDGGGPVRTVRTVLVAPVTSTRAYHIADWRED